MPMPSEPAEIAQALNWQMVSADSNAAIRCMEALCEENRDIHAHCAD